MIIWRGWGGLAFAFAALGVMFGLGLASSVVPEQWLPVTASLGMLAAAVGTYLLGRRLNTDGPQRKFDDWYVARSAQLEHLVDTGGFQIGAGQPRPRSFAEARDQAAWLLAEESRTLRARMFDIHTLFWVPMQYFGYVFAAIGILLFGIGIVQLVMN